MKLFQKKKMFVEVMVPAPKKKWYEKLFGVLKKD